MTQHIDVDTLRDWLEARRPVTVVDVRSPAARAEWAIPGSLHVDAAEALRTGQPGPLAEIALPADRPSSPSATPATAARSRPTRWSAAASTSGR